MMARLVGRNERGKRRDKAAFHVLLSTVSTKRVPTTTTTITVPTVSTSRQHHNGSYEADNDQQQGTS